jgi:Ala-tRNA(Pro) deacylase
MAINPRLQRLLESSGAHHEIVLHAEAFTARQVALRTHVPTRKLAKVVVFRDASGADLMVVVPALHQVDAAALRHVTGCTGTHLEDEQELLRIFPDCEVGAMPPFGKLYGLRMFVDPCLAREEDIWFQAGNHRELVNMRFEDFERLAAPFSMKGCLHEQMVAVGG